MGRNLALDYEAAKHVAVDPDPLRRLDLASNPNVQPEILYFLALDTETAVRGAVAANSNAPRHADLLLASDRDGAVRVMIAEKVGRLMPGLDPEARDKLSSLTVQVLETLARDTMQQVRLLLSDTLKQLGNAPNSVIQRLARDRDLDVAAPILEFSPVLTDADLLSIIASAPIQGALAAISRRDGLDGMVSHAVARHGDEPAIAALLANHSAQIREDTLDWIIDHAPPMSVWHGPLVRRPRLPGAAAERVARFVARELLEELAARPDLEAGYLDAVTTILTERAAVAPLLDIGGGNRRATLDRSAGRLTPELVMAAIQRRDFDYVVAAVALLADLPPTGVLRALQTQNAKGLSVAAWKGGLSMAATVALQADVAGVPPAAIVRPAGDGVPPLGTDEMLWQLELLAAAG